MKGIVRFLVRMIVLNIVLVPIMALGPLLYVIPFFCIVANPQDDFSGLAQLYFWVGPLSCAFWMLVSCHWPAVRRAQREGRLATWRESEGGMVCTVTKAARVHVRRTVRLVRSLRSRSWSFSAFAPATRTGICCGSRFCRSRRLPRLFCSGLVAGYGAGSRGTSSAEQRTTANCETSCGRLLSMRRTSATGTRTAGKGRDDGQPQLQQRRMCSRPFSSTARGTSRAGTWE